MKATIRKYFPKVEEVVDAVKPVIIEVNRKHAAAGRRRSHKTCALAVACEKKFHLDGVVIGRQVAFLVQGKRATRFRLPPSAAREITSFDRGASFEPGVYQLSVPSRRPGGGHHKVRNARGGERSLRHFTTGIRGIIGRV